VISRPSARARRSRPAVGRLLDAAVAILRDEGAAAVSVQRVADIAGTSKGLVHYHFSDKDALLTACTHQLTAQLVEDEAAALTSSTPASALDDLWAVLSRPAYRGRRRALLALLTAPTERTRLVLRDSSAARRDAAERTVDALTRLLRFEVPLSRSALSMAFMSFADGLTLEPSGEMAAPHRQAYDAFWLAVLSLTG
jgi:AcrR family transcriptional regulator